MRISRPHMFMQMAEIAAMRSTCFRGNVGAIVTHDNDVVAMGYNGPPSGQEHCKGNSCERRPDGGCQRSEHAEKNAVHRAVSKRGSLLWNCDLYCTYSPCPGCASAIIQTRVPRFFYRYSYRIPEGLQMLMDAGIACFRITPAGYLYSEETRSFLDAGDLRV